MSTATLQSEAASRVLCDFREGEGLRGFHLAASLWHLPALPVPAELWALHGDEEDISIELVLLRQHSGQNIPRWRPETHYLHFDLYVVLADIMPTGDTVRMARRCARRSLAGLMFPDPLQEEEPGLLLVDGHDTRAFAQCVAAALPRRKLGRLGRLQGFLGA